MFAQKRKNVALFLWVAFVFATFASFFHHHDNAEKPAVHSCEVCQFRANLQQALPLFVPPLEVPTSFEIVLPDFSLQFTETPLLCARLIRGPPTI